MSDTGKGKSEHLQPGKMYPFVQCSKHGSKQRTYVICIHVANGNLRVEHFVPATDASPGEICCGDEPGSHTVDDLTICCEGCAHERGFIPT